MKEFFFTNNHVIQKKLLTTNRFVAVTGISVGRAASCNSFETSVRHLLRLLKANLLQITSLWHCVSKWLLALQVGWSPNAPALLTNGVAVITGGAKVEQVLHKTHFHNCWNKIVDVIFPPPHDFSFTGPDSMSLSNQTERDWKPPAEVNQKHQW